MTSFLPRAGGKQPAEQLILLCNQPMQTQNGKVRFGGNRETRLSTHSGRRNRQHLPVTLRELPGLRHCLRHHRPWTPAGSVWWFRIQPRSSSGHSAGFCPSAPWGPWKLGLQTPRSHAPATWGRVRPGEESALTLAVLRLH
jgi:hypothetical protein